jgi:hypothetical protein
MYFKPDRTIGSKKYKLNGIRRTRSRTNQSHYKSKHFVELSSPLKGSHPILKMTILKKHKDVKHAYTIFVLMILTLAIAMYITIYFNTYIWNHI